MRFGPSAPPSLRLAAENVPDAGGSRPPAPIVDIGSWDPGADASVEAGRAPEEPSPHPDDLVYEIDGTGRLTNVSLAWDRFAIANGAPGLRAENVVGRPFWKFFDDRDGLVEEHQQLLERCRVRAQKGTFLLRCDAPEERRMLRMWIEPLARGHFRFRSRTLAVESLDPELYDRLLRVAQPLRVARCSHCNRFRVEDDWFEPEVAVRRDWERERPGRPRALVHTLCPNCRDFLRAIPQLVRRN